MKELEKVLERRERKRGREKRLEKTQETREGVKLFNLNRTRKNLERELKDVEKLKKRK